MNHKEHALIDKVKIYNFYVSDIKDLWELQARGIVTIVDNAKNYLMTANGEAYSSIVIEKTEFFDCFTYAMGKMGSYGRLELSVPDSECGNLTGLTSEEYSKRLDWISDYLKSNYGIIVNFSYARYSSIEINKTIALCDPISEYQRPLQLIKNLFPNQLRLQWISDTVSPEKDKDRNRVASVPTITGTSGKRGLTIKVYDKSTQLEKSRGIHIDGHYLRYEITLNAPKKVKDSLGTNSVHALTESALQEFFHSFIHRNVIKPWEKYQLTNTRQLIKILKGEHVQGSRVWVQNVLLMLADREIESKTIALLDIKHLIGLLNKLPFTSRSAKSRAKQRFLMVCSEKTPVFNHGDDDKLQEIMDKLSS